MPSTIAILAPGLIGGSAARAARERGAAQRIVLWARRPEAREALAKQPWCDAVAETPEEAAREADFVLLAAPVDVIPLLARRIASALPAGAVATDVGSVKARIVRESHGAIGPKAHFVGSHPMAGSEKTGWEHGRAGLFEGRTCFVTPLPDSDPAAVAAVSGFWRTIGARVAVVSPEQHDEIVAHISHLPQALASALCAFLAGKDLRWRDYAGGGLRDSTRIAGSDPALWRSILEQNQPLALEALRGLQNELAGLERALGEKNWEAVEAILARGREYRRGLRET